MTKAPHIRPDNTSEVAARPGPGLPRPVSAFARRSHTKSRPVSKSSTRPWWTSNLLAWSTVAVCVAALLGGAWLWRAKRPSGTYFSENYPSGVKKSDGYRIEDASGNQIAVGRLRWWHENGQLQRLSHADRAGHTTGNTTEWYPDGTLRSKSTITKGEWRIETNYRGGDRCADLHGPVSDLTGLGTVWYRSGAKAGEGVRIAGGSRVRSWHHNGQLEVDWTRNSEQAELILWDMEGNLSARWVQDGATGKRKFFRRDGGSWVSIDEIESFSHLMAQRLVTDGLLGLSDTLLVVDERQNAK